MTLIFQILAILAVAVIAFLVLRGGGARHQAVQRILLVLFVVGAAVSVIFPQVLTWIANLVGIGRGTDLLLYVSVIAFLAFVATSYRRSRQLETQITELSRQIALLGATVPDTTVPDTTVPEPSETPAKKPASRKRA